MKKRRPWNTVEEQVYSVASVSNKGVMNMNIATYVVPVTMKPKQYMIAVYRDTQTHKNVFEDKHLFLLQGFSLENISHIKTLGKKSGKNYNKAVYIQKQSFAFHQDIPYFTDAAFVLLCKGEKYFEVGDHDIIVATVVKTVLHQEKSLLTTKVLQTKKIIT